MLEASKFRLRVNFTQMVAFLGVCYDVIKYQTLQSNFVKMSLLLCKLCTRIWMNEFQRCKWCTADHLTKHLLIFIWNHIFHINSRNFFKNFCDFIFIDITCVKKNLSLVCCTVTRIYAWLSGLWFCFFVKICYSRFYS